MIYNGARNTLLAAALVGCLAFPAAAQVHSADTEQDYAISLSEMLRVIQFFNSDGYSCQAGTEDGYAPGPGATACATHDSDYAPQDWSVNLSELLRLIQFFNSAGYHTDCASEDTFSPGNGSHDPCGGEGEGEGEGEPVPGEMVSIPSGAFEMGDPWSEGNSDERPVHAVTLSAYQIGKYEVTNQEYADILNWANALGYLDTASTGTASANGQELLDVDDSDCQITWNGSQFAVDTRDTYSMAMHPVVEVSWYGAAAYCNWLSQSQGFTPCYNTSTWDCDFTKNGYRLPTEAQWERAAAWNGSAHLRYGNGSDSISCASANYDNGSVYCNPLGLSSYPYTSPVGYYSAASSPAGCYDMSGNVWEWCNDWWKRDYTSSPVTDPEGPSSGSYRLLRGGCWHDYDYNCRSARRGIYKPDLTRFNSGFRVSRTP